MLFLSPTSRRAGFTLVEMLVVCGVIAVMLAMVIPAFMGINGAANMTKAAYDVSATLENARSYARANNTYVWVGFFEESESLLTSGPVGTGRIVISTTASKDGTMIYTASSLPTTSAAMTPGLIQLNKLVKIDNVHLKTAGVNDPNNVFPIGSGTGSTFVTRPLVSDTSALWQVGEIALAAASSQAPFQYPVGNPAPSSTYTFKTAMQFSPRGEVRMNDASQPLQPILEIGLQPTHGTIPDTANRNVVAVQITGITGNVKIYRP